MPLRNVTLELSHLGTHETFFYSFLPPSVGNKHVHISPLNAVFTDTKYNV